MKTLNKKLKELQKNTRNMRDQQFRKKWRKQSSNLTKQASSSEQSKLLETAQRMLESQAAMEDLSLKEPAEQAMDENRLLKKEIYAICSIAICRSLKPESVTRLIELY